MRTLLIGIIRFSGNLLSKLAAVHQHTAEQHIILARESHDRLEAKAAELITKAQNISVDAGEVLVEGREAARASREEAAQCAAIADIVKSIK